MMHRERARGQPLMVLAVLMAGWIGARALAWNVPADAPDMVPLQAAATAPDIPPGHHAALAVRRAAAAAPALRSVPSAGFGLAPVALPPAWPSEPLPVAPAALAAPVPASTVDTPLAPAPPSSAAGQQMMIAGGHQLLWLAAAAMLPVPADIAARLERRQDANAVPLSRWSADGWVFLRRGGSAVTFPRLSGGGTYGASQTGAVLRYRIAPGDPHRPAIYLRAAGALNGTREQEAALGLTARPLAGLPVAVMAELRTTRDGAGIALRPAASLVTELAPQKLPLGFSGEAYVQAGYVSGRSATGFVDGLVRAERGIVSGGGFDLRAGGGAWGAKQRGAARIDVGPVASVRMRLGDTASARIEADWRFRVAGGAHPDSGPALTLSAGF